MFTSIYIYIYIYNSIIHLSSIHICPSDSLSMLRHMRNKCCLLATCPQSLGAQLMHVLAQARDSTA